MPDDRRRRRARPLAAAALAAALLACAGGGAVSRAVDPPAANAGGGDRSGGEAAPARLLVELAVPAQSPGAPPDEQRRAEIAAARERLLASLPTTGVRVVRTYDAIPFVALEVSPAAEAELRRSALVRRVTPDRLERTQ